VPSGFLEGDRNRCDNPLFFDKRVSIGCLLDAYVEG